MTQDPEDISKWITELITLSSRQQAQALQRLSGLIQRVNSGELDQKAVQQEYTHFIRDESAHFVEDLTRLGLSFQTALLELNRKYTDRFFEKVLGSSAAETQTADGQPGRSREIGIVLQGVIGEELLKSFVIENKRNDEEIVTFLVSEFTDEVSGEAFRPPLQIQPPRLALRPGEERIVSIRLPLLPELFKAQHTYHATILARGHVDVVLALRVEVSSPEIQIKVDKDNIQGVEPEMIIHERPARKMKPVRRSTVHNPPESAARQGNGGMPAHDDLTQIKGIGTAYAEKLYAAGVHSFAGLSQLSPERLREILGDVGSQRAEREGWIEQAIRAAGSRRAGRGEFRQQTTPGSKGDVE